MGDAIDEEVVGLGLSGLRGPLRSESRERRRLRGPSNPPWGDAVLVRLSML